jgi:hypothetical protein
MKLIPLLLVVLMASTNLFAKDADRPFAVEATNYPDGVLLQSENSDVGLQVSIAGPDGNVVSMSFAAFDPAFIFASDTSGQPIADGLYNYEVRPVPSKTYTREESSAMPDRNSVNFYKGPSVSPVNGSFRVVQGRIVDSELIEDYANVEGAVE